MPDNVSQNIMNRYITTRFEALTVVLLKIRVFWDVTPCRPANSDVSKYLHAACRLQNYQLQRHCCSSCNVITAILVQNVRNECSVPSGMGSRLSNECLKFHSIA